MRHELDIWRQNGWQLFEEVRVISQKLITRTSEGPSWAREISYFDSAQEKILLRTYRQVSWCLDNTVNRVAKKRHRGPIMGPSCPREISHFDSAQEKILLRTYRQVSWCLDNTVNRVAKKRQMIVIKRKHNIILNDSRRFILLQKERASFLVFRNE